MKHPLIGKRVVVRAPGSGVFFGTLAGYRSHKQKDGGIAILTDVQRIWRWDSGALDTFAIASNGITGGKISPVVSTATIDDAREIMELSQTAEQALSKVGVWRG